MTDIVLLDGGMGQDLVLVETHATRSEHLSGQIAGSAGPLAASNRPDTHPPYDQAVDRYSEIARPHAPKIDQRAMILRGYCKIDPAHIAELARALLVQNLRIA